ncbi:YgaP family membrane protein [Campylobacter geochelonis]|uniref:YgaP family membrane protein n=1 Tax=Campylobacter geochelonis TaxID=1780362 RepID=UPI000770A4EE|nr:DUF2892 domain-containing protein [Campylobacter geochelonis]CZE49878.1 Protein of uncharacterised function (DUF2892) [Campylobacter geochelonis]
MSRIDKILRVGVGLAILVIFGLIAPTWWAFIGLFPLVTGVSGFCPIYKILAKFNPSSKKINS